MSDHQTWAQYKARRQKEIGARPHDGPASIRQQSDPQFWAKLIGGAIGALLCLLVLALIVGLTIRAWEWAV